MNVAVFSTNDIVGGAARASERLCGGLWKMHDINVEYIVKNRKSMLGKTKVLRYANANLEDIESIISHYLINSNRTSLSNTLFSFSYADSDLPDLTKFDILNLHWIESFLSLNNLNELVKLKKPIVWTLHDMKPFTGGCHYSADCDKYRFECLDCLQLIDNTQRLTQKVLHVKQEIFNDANITIVSPSRWLADKARKSAIFKNKRIEVIPNSVDSCVFRAIDKAKAKRKFGIDPKKTVLTFGAMSHIEMRKGFRELYRSIELLKDKISDQNLVALFFGGDCTHDFPIPIVDIGHVDHDETLSYVYSAADIFILPSLEDNLPNMILESLSCATPVIAFDTGGASDIINEDNGKIVPKGDVKALSEAIVELIENKEKREQQGRNGRRLIRQKYQPHNQALLYRKLFGELQSEKFIYQDREININPYFDELIGFVYRNSPVGNKIVFSKQYNKFFKQVEQCKKNKTVVIYGYGTVGKTIKALIPEHVTAFVDKNSSLLSQDIVKDKVYNPQNLQNMQYDKIIISVLGREDEIIGYLVEKLHIDEKKIITFSI